MKKILLFTILFILSVSLFSCKNTDKTAVDEFIERFKIHHKNGFKMETGWYEGAMTTTEYNLESNERKISSVNFNAELEFSKIYSGEVKKAEYHEDKITYIDFDNNKYEEENSKVLYDGKYFYRKYDKYENQSLLTSLSEGTSNTGKVDFSFDFDNNIFDINEFEKIYKKYKKDSSDSTYSRIDYYDSSGILLLIREELNENGSKIYTDTFKFGIKCELVRLTSSVQDSSPKQNNTSILKTKTLQKANQVKISVPSHYETELVLKENEIMFGIYFN